MKIKLTRKQIKEILTEEFLIKQYWELNKTIQQIAKEIGCSKATILRKFNEFNIPIRTNSESHKGMPSGMLNKKHTEKTKQKMRKIKLGKYKGKNHPNFKGRVRDGQGYILIYSPNHPYKTKGNYVREQRLIVEKYLDRYLLPTEVVHHINEIKDDNCPKNLICFVSESAHQRFHKNPNKVKLEEIIFDGRKNKEK